MMKISTLSETTGVPVATLKYYLRRGLLPPGRALSRTQSDYDESHVERVRLIRALTDVGGLSLEAVGRVLATLEDPQSERIGVLAAAQYALSARDPATDPGTTAEEADDGGAQESRTHAWLRQRDWEVNAQDPLIGDLEQAWAACEAASIGLDADRMNAYADAVEQIAAVDIATVPAEPDRAIRQVVVGTVLVDPVLRTLRRLAQQHLAVSGNRKTT